MGQGTVVEERGNLGGRSVVEGSILEVDARVEVEVMATMQERHELWPQGRVTGSRIICSQREHLHSMRSL